MHIVHRRLPRADIIAVEGRLHGPAAEQLRLTLDQLIRAGRVRLVLDLAGVAALGNPGLPVLIAARRSALSRRIPGGSGDLCLANVGPAVRRSLALIGYQSFFPIYSDIAAAVASFGRAPAISFNQLTRRFV